MTLDKALVTDLLPDPGWFGPGKKEVTTASGAQMTLQISEVLERELQGLQQASGSQFLASSMHTILGSKAKDSAVPDGVAMIVMELAKHGSLDAASSTIGRKLTEAEIAGVFAQIVRGVQYLHGMKMVHRDLKPANVLAYDVAALPFLRLREPYYNDGHDGQAGLRVIRVRVSDFGITRPAAEEGATLGVGTLGYIAPELLHRRTESGRAPCEPSADVYSLGMLFLDLFCLNRKEAKLPASVEEAGGSRRASNLYASMTADSPAKRPDAEQIARDAFFVGGSNEMSAIDMATWISAADSSGYPELGQDLREAYPFISRKAFEGMSKRARAEYVAAVTKLSQSTRGDLNRILRINSARLRSILIISLLRFNLRRRSERECLDAAHSSPTSSYEKEFKFLGRPNGRISTDYYDINTGAAHHTTG
eukprot:g13687.t1